MFIARIFTVFFFILMMTLGSVCTLADADSESADQFPRIRLDWLGGSGPARLAYTARERSIGYRHLSREEAPPAIYFRYPEPRTVHFHMRDVAFPVRAWWLDADGCVLAFTDMEPGTDGHASPEPVIGVLEVPLFRLDDYPLEAGDCIRIGNELPASGALDQTHRKHAETPTESHAGSPRRSAQRRASIRGGKDTMQPQRAHHGQKQTGNQKP